MTTSAAAAFAAAPAAPAAAPAPAPTAAGAPPPISAPAPTAAAPAPAAANAAWYDTFENAEVKTWTAAKGFKDPSAVAESAYNLEKLIGFDKAGRTLVIPKDDAPPEEVKAFHAKLGVPDTPAGYKLPLPEGHDPKLAETIQGWMHKAGATPRVAEALTKEFVAFSAAEQQGKQAKLIADSDRAFADATTAWGKDAQANLELGKRFTAQMLPAEVTLDDGSKVSRQDFLERVFNSTGATRAMLELFAAAGGGLGEHKMRVPGDPPFGAETQAGAKAKIDALKADPIWAKAYLAGGEKEKAEMARLFQIAFPPVVQR